MLAKHHIPFQLKLDGSSKSTLQVMLKGDKLLLFWIFTLFLVFFQVSLASKSEKSLTETAKDGSKYELKIAPGGGNIAKKKKGKHKHKSKKSKKKSTEKEKSSESCGSCTWGEWSEGECTEV